MTTRGSTVFLVTLSLVALLTSWSCEYANVMALIAGSWLVLTHCATNRDRLRVGMSPRRTSKIESRRKIGFGAKTSLYAKKSIRPRCSKRLLEPLELCKLCCRAFPKLRQAILRFLPRAKRERARSWLRAPSIDDRIARRAHS